MNQEIKLPPLIAEHTTYIIQHLNSNPYALTKDECIALPDWCTPYNIGK
jgi:hypothetical protein